MALELVDSWTILASELQIQTLKHTATHYNYKPIYYWINVAESMVDKLKKKSLFITLPLILSSIEIISFKAELAF